MSQHASLHAGYARSTARCQRWCCQAATAVLVMKEGALLISRITYRVSNDLQIRIDATTSRREQELKHIL